MPEILHDFPTRAPIARVFEAISTPAGLDEWWTERACGSIADGAVLDLHFGPEYHWQATVTRCLAPRYFELTMTSAADDWLGSRIAFVLAERDGMTWVRFSHSGWPEVDEHYRTSSYCWAMYLRILKRHLEYGESVPYQRRLEV
jgi:uncharacterized protein YndB with AHSA1/START domain